MSMPPSERPSNAPPTLRLSKDGRLLAGVCAGLAVHPGWMGVLAWRALFVAGALITTLPAAIVYVALWQLMRDADRTRRAHLAPRERRHAPMPKVSWSMRRRLKRLVGLVEEVRGCHDRPVVDLVDETLDAIKLLAPRLQKPRTVRDERLAEAAFVRFPALIGKLRAMSPDDVVVEVDPARRTPGGVLLERLKVLHDGFNQEATRDVETAGVAEAEAEGGERARTLHDRIRPLAARLGQSGAAASVGTLDAIIAKLEFLLERADGAADGMDLRPFKVRRIAFEYLPQTLERYLQLPAELAGQLRIAAGPTPAQSLQEQLELLDARLGDLTRSYYERDAAALLVHGRFLRDTFGQGALRLEDDPATPQAAPATIVAGTFPPPGSRRESERSVA
jgi:phage shock protein PspC (stress-responsive transcriptional regulator)